MTFEGIFSSTGVPLSWTLSDVCLCQLGRGSNLLMHWVDRKKSSNRNWIVQKIYFRWTIYLQFSNLIGSCSTWLVLALTLKTVMHVYFLVDLIFQAVLLYFNGQNVNNGAFVLLVRLNWRIRDSVSFVGHHFSVLWTFAKLICGLFSVAIRAVISSSSKNAEVRKRGYMLFI